MSEPTTITIKNDTETEVIKKIEGILLTVAAIWNTDAEKDKRIFGIRLALEEGVVNAIKHGHEGDKSKEVCVTYTVQKTEFKVTITDKGKGFDPDSVPDPTALENLERPTGRGLFLMRNAMTEVVIMFPEEGGTHVLMTKHALEKKK